MVFFLVLLCAAESQTDSSLHEKIAPYSTWVLSVGVHFHGCQENLANWQYLSQRAAEHQRNCSQSHPPDYFNTRSWIDIIKSLCHLLHFHCFVVAVVASVVVPKCSVALFSSPLHSGVLTGIESQHCFYFEIMLGVITGSRILTVYFM